MFLAYRKQLPRKVTYLTTLCNRSSVVELVITRITYIALSVITTQHIHHLQNHQNKANPHPSFQ